MRPLEDRCTCPHGIRALGRLHGVDMGRGRVRLSTAKDCPVHDSCHGYTPAVRVTMRHAQCPVHGLKNCPEP